MSLAQLFFSFQSSNKKDPFDVDDFVFLPENFAAIKFLKQFLAQEHFSRSHFTSLVIKGSESCGKTHLLHIFAKNSCATFLKAEEVSHLNFANYFQKNKFYILENFDQIKNEELLLNLINSASEACSFLILTTSEEANFKLKDLTSRLKNIFTTEIKNPNHEAMKQLLVNGFARRQIKISNQLIDFISDNIERTYAAIFLAIKRVEFFCSESGKNIKMKDVKELFVAAK